MQEAVIINLANHDPKKLDEAIPEMTPVLEDASGKQDEIKYADWSWKRSWENDD